MEKYSFYRNLLTYTRGPLVYTGDHNATVVPVYASKGSPCVYVV